MRVPPLSLQPIIENAFVHGLEPGERPGQFLLSVQKACEYVVISVQDNGVGLSSEQVYKLLAEEETGDASAAEKTHTTGLGLAQVRGRLRHYYGETVPDGDRKRSGRRHYDESDAAAGGAGEEVVVGKVEISWQTAPSITIHRSQSIGIKFF